METNAANTNATKQHVDPRTKIIAELNRAIDDFIDKYKSGPQQGTPEWLAAKQFTIGGSEIASIDGGNPYKKLDGLVADKIGLTEFRGDIRTRWGKLFEPLIGEYAGHVFNTEVKGEFLFITGINPDQSYSPDGLAVVDMAHFEKSSVVDQQRGTSQKITIALLEFKCPFNRIPDGKIPAYYLSQVKSGLDTIPIVTVGIYMEAVYRRCALADWRFTQYYDSSIHSKDDVLKPALPLARGIVIFHFNTAYKVPDNDRARTRHRERMCLLYNYAEECGITIRGVAPGNEEDPAPLDAANIGDLGGVPQEFVDLLFELLEEKIIKPWYGPTIYAVSCANGSAYSNATNTSTGATDAPCGDFCACPLVARRTIESFAADPKHADLVVIGVMPWKLLRCDIHVVQPDKGYVARYQSEISRAIGIVRECLDAKDKKMEVFEKHFPKHDIYKKFF